MQSGTVDRYIDENPQHYGYYYVDHATLTVLDDRDGSIVWSTSI